MKQAEQKTTLEQRLLSTGENLGSSDWIAIPQSMITGFGEVTLDPDPMHMNPDWVRANTSRDNTIAFGFLTLSLMTHMFSSSLKIKSSSESPVPGHFLNYGFNRLRFVRPVPVDSRIRGHFQRSQEPARVDPKKTVFSVNASVEIEGLDEPALVAEWLVAWVRDAHEKSS